MVPMAVVLASRTPRDVGHPQLCCFKVEVTDPEQGERGEVGHPSLWKLKVHHYQG